MEAVASTGRSGAGRRAPGPPWACTVLAACAGLVSVVLLLPPGLVPAGVRMAAGVAGLVAAGLAGAAGRRQRAHEGRLEAALAACEADAFYRQLFEAANDALVVFDPQTEQVLYANDRACALYGYAPGELPGVSLRTLSFDVAGGEAAIAQTLQDGALHDLETVQLRRDGTPMHVLVSASVVQVGGRVAILSINRDVSRYWQAAVALIESEERFHSLLHALHDVAWSSSADGREMLYINPAVETVYGRPAADFLRNPSLWLDVVHPNDRSRVERASVALREGQPVEVEYRIVRPDGTVRWLHDRKDVIRDAEGQPLRLGGITTDITARREAEEKLRRREAALRSFYESSPFMMGVVDVYPDRIVHHSDNPAAARFFGTTPDGMRNRSAAELGVPDESLRRWLDAYHTCLERQEPVRFEYQHVAAERLRWLSATVSPIGPSEYGVPRCSYVAEDVTERRRAAEVRRLLETALANTAESVLITDAELDLPGPRIVYVNRGFEQMTGYRADEVLGKTPRLLQGPQTDRAVMERLRARLSRGEAFLGETTNYRKDGTPFRIEWSISPVRDTEGRIVHFVAVQRDITERKAAAEALREREERFRKLVQHSSDVISIVQPDGLARYHAESVRHVLGYEAADLAGRSVFEHVHPEDLGVVVERFQALAGQPGAQVTVEFRWRHVDGSWVWFEAIGNNLVHDPAIDGILINSRDITARKAAEAALQASEHKYRSVVENVRDVVFQTDAEGRWTYLNAAWTRVTDIPLADALGVPFLDFVHPDDHEHNRKQFEPLIQRKKEVCRHEVRYRTRNGDYRWMEVYATLRLDEAGRPVGTAGTLHDVSRRKEAMDALVLALERERELGGLKNRFVSMASHELRTPLTAIRSSAELLHQFGEHWDAARRKLLFERILRGVDVMMELIEDVLVLGKADTGGLAFAPQRLDLGLFCQALAHEFRQGAGARHTLGVHLPAAPVEATADPKLLRHIVANLLSNAVKYAPEGSAVELRLEAAGDRVTLTVADHGIGIPPEDLPRLFEPFHRGANVGTRSGTGLGLAIARRAVDLHGGTIRATSTVGEGTTMTVTLPVEAPAPPGEA